MTDTPIRTHTTTVLRHTSNVTVPTDWEPGTPVLVVAGLPEDAVVVPAWGDTPPRSEVDEGDIVATIVVPKPVPAPPATVMCDYPLPEGCEIRLPEGCEIRLPEGCEIRLPEGCELRPLCQVPEGWEWQGAYGTWIEANQKVDPAAIGVVLCRPKPAADRLAVLVDPAPAGDDEPHDCRSCTTTWQGCNDEMRETGTPCCLACKIKVTHGQSLAQDRLTPPEPQADTPAPQGRWTVTDGCVTRDDGAEVSCFGPPHTDESADRALAVEVAGLLNGRRDGTAPTPDLTPLFAALDDYEHAGPVDDHLPLLGRLVIAVRALRDGGTR